MYMCLPPRVLGGPDYKATACCIGSTGEYTKGFQQGMGGYIYSVGPVLTSNMSGVTFLPYPLLRPLRHTR